MAKAESITGHDEAASIPLPRLSATERDTVNLILASTTRNWESDIHNLLYASEAAAFVIEETLSSVGSAAEVTLNDGEANRLLYVVYQVHRMMTSFSDKYHSALKA